MRFAYCALVEGMSIWSAVRALKKRNVNTLTGSVSVEARLMPDIGVGYN